jgi:hypothetical protein
MDSGGSELTLIHRSVSYFCNAWNANANLEQIRQDA